MEFILTNPFSHCKIYRRNTRETKSYSPINSIYLYKSEAVTMDLRENNPKFVE